MRGQLAVGCCDYPWVSLESRAPFGNRRTAGVQPGSAVLPPSLARLTLCSPEPGPAILSPAARLLVPLGLPSLHCMCTCPGICPREEPVWPQPWSLCCFRSALFGQVAAQPGGTAGGVPPLHPPLPCTARAQDCPRPPRHLWQVEEGAWGERLQCGHLGPQLWSGVWCGGASCNRCLSVLGSDF